MHLWLRTPLNSSRSSSPEPPIMPNFIMDSSPALCQILSAGGAAVWIIFIELHFMQAPVGAAAGEQAPRARRFEDPPLVQHDDPSQCAMVDKRMMAKIVRLAITSSSAACTSRSDSVSRALVASSSIRIGGLRKCGGNGQALATAAGQAQRRARRSPYRWRASAR